jgi:uncharacterized membrane protein YjgN (DUF898 family)
MSQVSSQRFSFHGTGSELFVIYVVNVLLTIVTFGIYSFWARTKVRNYLWAHTEFDGDRFAYHGTGGELFSGYLRAMGVIILFAFVAMVGVPLLLAPVLGEQIAAALAVVIFYGGVAVLIPIGTVGGRRYRLNRTSWRGIRFGFHSPIGDFIRLFIGGGILTVLTLSLYLPFHSNNLRQYLVEGARFGSLPMKYDGEGRDLWGPYVIALLLTIPTLGLYWFWFAARRSRYYWEHTSFAGVHFTNTVTGGGLLGNTLGNALLVVFTLGLGFPWAQVRHNRYLCENLALEGTLDLADVQQQARSTSNGEGLAGALEVDALDLDIGM